MSPEPKRPVVEGEGIPGDAARAEARESVAHVVLVLSALCGVLMALCISLMVRLDSGYPPALKPQLFAALLGMPAPGLSLPGLNGETLTLPHPGAPGPGEKPGSSLIFFTDSACRACDATYPSVRQAAERLPVFVVGAGSRAELKRKLADHEIAAVTGYDSLLSVANAYGVDRVPSALLVDGGGIVKAGESGAGCVERVLERLRVLQKGSR